MDNNQTNDDAEYKQWREENSDIVQYVYNASKEDKEVIIKLLWEIYGKGGIIEYLDKVSADHNKLLVEHIELLKKHNKLSVEHYELLTQVDYLGEVNKTKANTRYISNAGKPNALAAVTNPEPNRNIRAKKIIDYLYLEKHDSLDKFRNKVAPEANAYRKNQRIINEENLKIHIKGAINDLMKNTDLFPSQKAIFKKLEKSYVKPNGDKDKTRYTEKSLTGKLEKLIPDIKKEMGLSKPVNFSFPISQNCQ